MHQIIALTYITIEGLLWSGNYNSEVGYVELFTCGLTFTEAVNACKERSGVLWAASLMRKGGGGDSDTLLTAAGGGYFWSGVPYTYLDLKLDPMYVYSGLRLLRPPLDQHKWP